MGLLSNTSAPAEEQVKKGIVEATFAMSADMAMSGGKALSLRIEAAMSQAILDNPGAEPEVVKAAMMAARVKVLDETFAQPQELFPPAQPVEA